MMKRDWDLIRTILLRMEQGNPAEIYYNGIEGYPYEQVLYHLYLLYRAGLIEGIATQAIADLYPEVYPTTITWKGHDLLERIRDDSFWTKAKQALQEAGIEFAKASIPEVVKAILGIRS